MNATNIGERKVSFPKAQRFNHQGHTRNSQSFKDMSPGPGDYDTLNHKSIDSSHRNYEFTGFGNENMRMTTTVTHFGNKTLYKVGKPQQKKIYFAEYAKEFQNIDGPGPGKYQFENYNSSFQ